MLQVSKPQIEELLDRARAVQVIIFDTDGVLFGNVSVSAEIEETKSRSFADGQGVAMLIRAQIKVCFVTGGEPGPLELFARRFSGLLGDKAEILNVFTKVNGRKRLEKISQWLQKIKLGWRDCAYMGDDLQDLWAMEQAGLRIAPAQAEKLVKDLAHFITPRRGGDGAIRDLVNLVIEAKKLDPRSLVE